MATRQENQGRAHAGLGMEPDVDTSPESSDRMMSEIDEMVYLHFGARIVSAVGGPTNSMREVVSGLSEDMKPEPRIPASDIDPDTHKPYQ